MRSVDPDHPDDPAELRGSRLEALYELSLALATTEDAEQIAARVLDILLGELDCADGWAVEIDAGAHQFVALDGVGGGTRVLAALSTRTAPPSWALLRALESAGLVWLADRTQIDGRLPAVAAAFADVHTLVLVPLRPAGETVPVGAVGLTFDHPRAPEGSDPAFLEAVGELAGQAVHRARLRRSEALARTVAAQAVDRAERVGALAAALVAAHTVDDVIAVISAHVQRAMDSHTFSLREVHLDQQIARAIGLGGAPLDYQERFPDVRLDLPSAIAEAAATGKPVFVTSSEDNRRRYGIEGADRYEAARIEALARLPLTVEGELIAVLSVGYREPREFTDEDRLFLTTIADLAAQALGRAVRSERVRADARRHRLLSAAQSAINQQLDPVTQLNALAKAIVPELADFSSVQVLARPVPAGATPPLPVITERVASEVSGGIEPLPHWRGIEWYEGDPLIDAIRRGSLLLYPVTSSTPPPWSRRSAHDIAFRHGLHHLVLAPVLVEGMVVAVAWFGVTGERSAWTPQDLETIEQIAEYAALALKHGLEFEQSRERALLLAWRAALVEGLQDALFVVKPGGDVIEINEPFQTMFGYGPDGLPYAVPHPWWPDPTEDPEAFEFVRQAGIEAARRGRGRELLPLRHRDGHRVWVDCSVETVPDREGSGTVLLGVLRDITAAHRTAQRDRLLAELGSVSQSADLLTRLHTMLVSAVPVLGDLAILSLTGPDGRLVRTAGTDGDTGSEPVARAVPDGQVDRWLTGEPLALAEPAGLAELVEAVGVDASQRSSFRSALVVPLVAEGRLFGLLSFLDTAPRRRDEGDAALAQEVGRRITDLIQADRFARREQLLNETSAALAAAATAVEAAAALAAAMVSAFDAAGVAVYAIDEPPSRLQLLYTRGLPAQVTQTLGVVDLDDPQMMSAEAARTKAGVWLNSRQAWHERAPDVVQKVGDAKDANALCALPILVAGRVVGALTAIFRTERSFPPAERTFAMTLVSQAAQAFDRAALSDARWRAVHTELAARRAAADAADRAERLGNLAAALVAAQTPMEVAEILTDHVQQAVNCDSFSLREIHPEAGLARAVRSRGVPPGYVEEFTDVPLGQPSALSEVAETRMPVFIASPEEHYARYGDPQAHHIAANVKALARIPLLVEDELIAILSVAYNHAREFDDDDRLFLTTVADLAAQALGRSLRSARLRAEARRHRLLSAAQSAINQRLDPITQLQGLADAIVPELADFSSVQVLAAPVPAGVTPPLPVITGRVASKVSGPIEPLPHLSHIEWYDGDPLVEAIRQGTLLVFPVTSPMPPAWSRRSAHDITFRHGLHHLVLAPVLIDRMVVAVAWFGVCNERPPWDAEELSIIEEIAGFAARALEQGFSYQQTRETALILQQSLLTAPPTVPGLELAGRYRPAGRDEVGGDWYDAFILESGRLALAVGDVVGHDITAAAAMGQLRAVLRTLAIDENLDPGAVLERLAAANRLLDITPFATAVFGRLVPLKSDWAFAWASAGHLPPLMIQPDGSWRRLDQHARGTALARGLATRYDVGRVRVEPGATLLLYTDGLVERRGIDIDVAIDQLAERAVTLLGRSVEDMCDGLLAGAPDTDDIALLVVRADRPDELRA